jgi:peroxiredoxin
LLKNGHLVLVVHLCLLLAGCGDNLAPSGEDKRPVVQADTIGPGVTQKAPDFSVSDSNGTNVTLADALSGKNGIVLYFTMWCPICDSHMNNMRATIAPLFPTVGFYLVDYVSGSVADAASAAASNGYAGGVFTTLADLGQSMLGSYQATMGTTVVIDSSGIIRMNEDYRDGLHLQAVLSALR